MGKKNGTKVNKRIILLVAVFTVYAGSVVGAFIAGQNNGNKTANGSQVSVNQGDDSARLEALQTQGGQFFQNYKKQIEENKATGTDLIGLYINGASTGAAVDAPEAAEYAKNALGLMSPEMKRDARNKDLVDRLEKIAAGNYD